MIRHGMPISSQGPTRCVTSSLAGGVSPTVYRRWWRLVRWRSIGRGCTSLSSYAPPLLGHFDYEHMKAIHRHIFQDTFAWAGQERSAPMGGPMIKFGPDVSAFPDFDPRDYSVPHEYAPAGRQLTEAATHEYALLQEADYLRGLALSEFVDNLALRWVSGSSHLRV